MTEVPPQSKRCPKCEEVKTLDQFSKNASNKDGLQVYCKPCALISQREWVAANPERQREISKKAALKATYGLSMDDFNRMWDQQAGMCHICGTALGRHKHAVDHNHITGAVRAILCKQCNTALGLFKDSPAIIDRAASYLRTFGHYGPPTFEGAAASP